MVAGGWGEGIVREFGKVMYTLLYSKQITSKVVPIVRHMELYSMLPARLDGRGVGGEWIQVYVPLSPFAVHPPQLLIGYSPIQNKKFKKQRLYGNWSIVWGMNWCVTGKMEGKGTIWALGYLIPNLASRILFHTLVVENLPANAGDMGLILGQEESTKRIRSNYWARTS